MIDGKFTTNDSSYVLPGTSNNVNVVFWRFLGETKFRSFPVKGDSWSVRITGLKPGNNFVRFYGVNSETKQKTETANGNIVRSRN